MSAHHACGSAIYSATVSTTALVVSSGSNTHPALLLPPLQAARSTSLGLLQLRRSLGVVRRHVLLQVADCPPATASMIHRRISHLPQLPPTSIRTASQPLSLARMHCQNMIIPPLLTSLDGSRVASRASLCAPPCGLVRGGNILPTTPTLLGHIDWCMTSSMAWTSAIEAAVVFASRVRTSSKAMPSARPSVHLSPRMQPFIGSSDLSLPLLSILPLLAPQDSGKARQAWDVSYHSSSISPA